MSSIKLSPTLSTVTPDTLVFEFMIHLTYTCAGVSIGGIEIVFVLKLSARADKVDTSCQVPPDILYCTLKLRGPVAEDLCLADTVIFQ